MLGSRPTTDPLPGIGWIKRQAVKALKGIWLASSGVCASASISSHCRLQSSAPPGPVESRQPSRGTAGT